MNLISMILTFGIYTLDLVLDIIHSSYDDMEQENQNILKEIWCVTKGEKMFKFLSGMWQVLVQKTLEFIAWCKHNRIASKGQKCLKI